MMGLSAQDANIQAIFAEAEAQMAWPWPGDRPSYVFSENAMGVDQQGLLRNVYRAAYTPATRQEIVDSALIRAYAKPLLVALVLHVLCSKLRKLIELSPWAAGAADSQCLHDGVLAVRNLLATVAEPDRLAFMRSFVEQSSHAIMMFRDGHSPDAPRPYNPITPSPLQQMDADVSLPGSGWREAAMATGILGVGLSDGAWTFEPIDPGDPRPCVVRVKSTTGTANVFFAANSHAALRLQHHGHLDDGDDAILIHSLETREPLSRSPRGAPGRTGRALLRKVSIAQLMKETVTSAELIQRFREEAAI